MRLQSSRAVLSEVDLYRQKYIWCTYTYHTGNKVFTYCIMNPFKMDTASSTPNKINLCCSNVV